MRAYVSLVARHSARAGEWLKGTNDAVADYSALVFLIASVVEA
jgi:hypothetical protein